MPSKKQKDKPPPPPTPTSSLDLGESTHPIGGVDGEKDSAVDRLLLFTLPTEPCTFYTDDDIQELKQKTDEEVDKIITNLKGVTEEYMPLNVFRCVSSLAHCKRYIAKDEQENFFNTWKDRIAALKSYHRYSEALLKRACPDEYNAVEVKLDWNTMSKRFSYDKHFEDSKATFYDRMKHFVTRSEAKAPTKVTRSSTKRQRDDDDDDDEVEVISEPPRKSKREVKPPKDTPKRDTSKKGKPSKVTKTKASRKRGKNSGSSDTSCSSSSVPPDPLLASISDMQQELQAIHMGTNANQDSLDSLIKIQSVASNLISKHIHQQTKKVEQSISKVKGLHATRVKSQDDRRELIDSAMEIINALYHSYLKVTARYYSTLWWNNPPSHREGTLRYVRNFVGPIHPQPMPPIPGENQFTFGFSSVSIDRLRLSGSDQEMKI